MRAAGCLSESQAPFSRLLATHRSGTVDLSNRLWTVLVLNLWHKRWIESSRPRPAARSDVATASA